MRVALLYNIRSLTGSPDSRHRKFEVVSGHEAEVWGVRIVHRVKGRDFTIFVTPSRIVIHNGTRRVSFLFSGKEAETKSSEEMQCQTELMWSEDNGKD